MRTMTRHYTSLLAPMIVGLSLLFASGAQAEEESEVPGWFRVDSDGLGLQLWFGATHSLGGLDIASDIYVADNFSGGGSFGEFDIGPVFSFGPVTLTPMIGLGMHWEASRATTIIAPQLFTIIDGGPIYFESWIQTFLTSPLLDGGGDSLYTRNFLLFGLSDHIALGPQVEATIALNDEAGDGLTSLPVGGAISLNYGKDNTLLLFLGYETQAEDEPALAGRFTFIRTW